MSDTDFEAFFERRMRAAEDYVRGDGNAVDQLVPHEGEASFHSPGGDTCTGAEAVAARYLKDAKGFKPVGRSRFDVLQKHASGDLGFWTGFQVAKVQVGDMKAPTDMRIRVTEVFFKKRGGAWKMIHRHADFGEPPAT